MYQLQLQLSYKNRKLEEHSSKIIIIRERIPNVLGLLNRNAH
jgi:hypothetical protein